MPEVIYKIKYDDYDEQGSLDYEIRNEEGEAPMCAHDLTGWWSGWSTPPYHNQYREEIREEKPCNSGCHIVKFEHVRLNRGFNYITIEVIESL